MIGSPIFLVFTSFFEDCIEKNHTYVPKNHIIFLNLHDRKCDFCCKYKDFGTFDREKRDLWMKFYFHRKNLVSVLIIFFYPSTFTFHNTVTNSMIYSEIDFQKCKIISVGGMLAWRTQIGLHLAAQFNNAVGNDIVLFNCNVLASGGCQVSLVPFTSFTVLAQPAFYSYCFAIFAKLL